MQLFVVGLLIRISLASTRWKPHMKSFTHSIKQGGCQQDQEISLFEFTEGPGIITNQWFTGKGCINQDTIIRYYIDGETRPSIDMNLYMAHGIGYVDEKNSEVIDDAPNYACSKTENILYPEECSSQQNIKKSDFDGRVDEPEIPWGTRRMGHVANDGGLYNTFRIPFQRSVFVSMISKTNGMYWYNVGGVKNYPLVIGDLELPSSARLRLYKKENVTVQPFDYIFLATVVNRSGFLYQLTLNTESETFNSLEACFRTIIDDDNDDDNDKIQYLSSGTEDLFLSAYYFSGGTFHTEQAGLSYKQDPGRMCAYRFFEDNPVLFDKSFSLIWRCGELVDNKCFKLRQRNCLRKYGAESCVAERDKEAMADFSKNIKKTKPTVINSYAWIYEW